MLNNESLYDKLESMLKEVCTVCCDNDIPCFLIEEALVSAVRGKKLPRSRKTFTMAIYEKDVEKFVKAVEILDKRAVESLSNNKKYPGFNMRYVDTNTTCYDVSNEKNLLIHNSLGINICILFDERKTKTTVSKVHKKVDLAWSRLIVRKKNSFKKSLFLTAYNILNLYKSCCYKVKSENSSTNIELFLSNGKMIKCNKSLFGVGTYLDFHDYKFMVPAEPVKISLYTNNNSLLLKSGGTNKVKHSDIISLVYSGEDFIKNIEKQGINLKECAKKYNSYTLWRKEKFSPIWKRRIKFYSYYYLTKDRFKHYFDLCGEKKDELLGLYKEENFEELTLVLGEYIKELKKYSKTNKGLFFDKDIYLIAIATMLHNIYSNEKFPGIADEEVDSIRKHVDKIFWQHFQPIDLFIEEIPVSKENMEAVRTEIKAEIDVMISNFESKYRNVLL